MRLSGNLSSLSTHKYSEQLGTQVPRAYLGQPEFKVRLVVLLAQLVLLEQLEQLDMLVQLVLLEQQE
jgi:hypothetical protein